jgi:hypothetical protein
MNYLCIGAGIASFGRLCPPLALRKLSGLGSLAVASWFKERIKRAAAISPRDCEHA